MGGNCGGRHLWPASYEAARRVYTAQLVATYSLDSRPPALNNEKKGICSETSARQRG